MVIKGMAGLLRKFKALDEATQGRILERALVAGALPIQNDAKRKAPVRTGTLRRSIHIGGHTDQAGDFAGNDIGGNESNKDHATVLIGTDVEYAMRQEFGFNDTDSLGRHFNQPPHPYMRPAFDENVDAARREVGQAFKILIERATGTNLS